MQSKRKELTSWYQEIMESSEKNINIKTRALICFWTFIISFVLSFVLTKKLGTFILQPFKIAHKI